MLSNFVSSERSQIFPWSFTTHITNNGKNNFSSWRRVRFHWRNCFIDHKTAKTAQVLGRDVQEHLFPIIVKSRKIRSQCEQVSI